MLPVEHFDADTHARILTTSSRLSFLKNTNHGQPRQGIGFKVGGVVRTKKILVILFVEEVVTASAFVVPIAMSHSAFGAGEAKAPDTTTAIELCSLNAKQVLCIKFVMGDSNATCSLAYNQTINEAHGM